MVTLATPDKDGRATGCVTDVDTALLDELAGSPEDYYVNVHSAAFPDGAARGQMQVAIDEGDLLATQLSGAQEIGPDGQAGAGDPDGTGVATVAVSTAARRVCVEISAQAITLPAVAAHIRQARAGANGPVVIPLTAPDASGFSTGCVRQVDQALVDALAVDPVGFYVFTARSQTGRLAGAARCTPLSTANGPSRSVGPAPSTSPWAPSPTPNAGSRSTRRPVAPSSRCSRPRTAGPGRLVRSRLVRLRRPRRHLCRAPGQGGRVPAGAVGGHWDPSTRWAQFRDPDGNTYGFPSEAPRGA